VLGLVLLAGRKKHLWMGMSAMVTERFPGTIAKHRRISATIGTGFGPPLWLVYLKHLALLLVGAVPIVYWAVSGS
jgi:hypothetical protein